MVIYLKVQSCKILSACLSVHQTSGYGLILSHLKTVAWSVVQESHTKWGCIWCFIIYGVGGIRPDHTWTCSNLFICGAIPATLGPPLRPSPGSHPHGIPYMGPPPPLWSPVDMFKLVYLDLTIQGSPESVEKRVVGFRLKGCLVNDIVKIANLLRNCLDLFTIKHYCLPQ